MRALSGTLVLVSCLAASCGLFPKKSGEGSKGGKTNVPGPAGNGAEDVKAKQKKVADRKARDAAQKAKDDAAEEAAEKERSSPSGKAGGDAKRDTVALNGLKPVQSAPKAFLGQWVAECEPSSDAPYASKRYEVEIHDTEYLLRAVDFYDAKCAKRARVDAVRIAMKDSVASAVADRIAFTPVPGTITRTYLGTNAARDARSRKHCGVENWEAGVERESLVPMNCWNYRLIHNDGVFEARIDGGSLTLADTTYSKGTDPSLAAFDDSVFVPNPSITGYFPTPCLKFTITGNREFPSRSINSYHFFDALDGDTVSKGETYFYDDACTHPVVSRRTSGRISRAEYVASLRNWRFDVEWSPVRERSVFGARAAEEANSRPFCGGPGWRPGEWRDVTKHIDESSITCDSSLEGGKVLYLDFSKEAAAIYSNTAAPRPAVHDDTGLAAPKPAYEGAWITDCIPSASGSTRVMWDFGPGRVDLYAVSFEGAACSSVNMYTVTRSSDAAISTLDYEGQFRFRGTQKSRLLALGNASLANTFNVISRCARNDWAVGVFVDISATAGCDNTPLEPFDLTARLQGVGKASVLTIDSLQFKPTTWPFANLPKAP